MFFNIKYILYFISSVIRDSKMDNKVLFSFYSDCMKLGLSEMEQSKEIFKVYHKYGRVYNLDVDQFRSQINLSYLNYIASNEDKDCLYYYSPLTYNMLRDIYADLKLEFKINKFNKESKKYLIDNLIKLNVTKNYLMNNLNNKELKSNIEFLYKPFNNTTIHVFDDFITYPERNNSLEIFNRSVDDKMYDDIWQSNNLLRRFISGFVAGTDVLYMGVIHLIDFMNKKYQQLEHMYENHCIKRNLMEVINRSEERYIAGLISIYDHWSAFLYDRKLSAIYYFNSLGNNPLQYAYNKNMHFYCYYNQYFNNKTCHSNMTYVKNKIVELVLCTFRAENIILNLNISQLKSGYCGIYSITYILLCIQNSIEKVEDIRYVYNYFRFKGDKTMSYLRTIFFNNNKDAGLTFEEHHAEIIDMLR